MRRALAAAVLVFTLSGCIVAPITTPSTPMTYAWVMAHDWDNWGVQIGGKNDADGIKVAVYWWVGCHPRCEREGFQEYETLEPGSEHQGGVIWQADGWHLTWDGYDRAVVNIGSPDTAHYQHATERTTQ